MAYGLKASSCDPLTFQPTDLQNFYTVIKNIMCVS